MLLFSNIQGASAFICTHLYIESNIFVPSKILDVFDVFQMLGLRVKVFVELSKFLLLNPLSSENNLENWGIYTNSKLSSAAGRNRHQLVHPASDDDFKICQNEQVNKCLC